MKGLRGGQYKPLSEKDIIKIHETSLRILEEIGVRVALEEALQIFKRHGAKIEGEIVRIPPSVVEKGLQLVPHQFLMAGREEKDDLHMEDKRVYLGTGGRPSRSSIWRQEPQGRGAFKILRGLQDLWTDWRTSISI
jgi:trimethylamine--corrinoid protein Co-methyltransferase